MEPTFESFISNYPAAVSETASLVREMILSMFNQVEEKIDTSARMVAYMLGTGYRDTLCTIIPSQKTIKIGFYKGALLNDPQSLLEGTGKVHRYIEIKDFYARKDYLNLLIEEAFNLWKKS